MEEGKKRHLPIIGVSRRKMLRFHWSIRTLLIHPPLMLPKEEAVCLSLSAHRLRLPRSLIRRMQHANARSHTFRSCNKHGRCSLPPVAADVPPNAPTRVQQHARSRCRLTPCPTPTPPIPAREANPPQEQQQAAPQDHPPPRPLPRRRPLPPRLRWNPLAPLRVESSRGYSAP